VDDFVYQERGKHNVAAFEIIKGTVSFVASAVAKTGDMKIGTPTAAIGIRGTTGIVEIRTAAVAGGPSEVSIKLYSDADGHVGTIEVFGRDGSQLGVLTGGATGFLVRIAAPGALQRFSAVPLQISPQELERDRGFVRQTFSVQQIGRRINLRRQNLLRQDRQLSPTPRLRRLNLLPPPTRSVGPTLLQPGTLRAPAAGRAGPAAIARQYAAPGYAAGATVTGSAVARAEPAITARRSQIARTTVGLFWPKLAR